MSEGSWDKMGYFVVVQKPGMEIREKKKNNWQENLIMEMLALVIIG